MIGVGLALDALPVRRHGPAGPGAPAPVPLAFLPTLTTPGATWHVVLANERLMEGYAGPLAQAGNGEGVSGTVSLGAGSTGITAADLPAPVTALYGWFDQSGGNRHFGQDTLANRPHLRAESTMGGRLAAAFWGTDSRPGVRASMDGPQALAAGNRTEIWVVDPGCSIENAVYAEHQSAAGTPVRFTYHATPDGGVLRAGGGESDVVVAAQPQVWVIVDGPGGGALFVNGAKHALPAGSGSDTLTRTVLGWSPAATIGSAASARVAAYAAIAGAVNDADALAISAALAGRFAVNPAYSLNLVHIGDSIVAGVFASDTIALKAMLLPQLAARTRYMNLGVPGKTLAACYADRASYEGKLLVPGRRSVALIDAAINDLCADAEGAALYAQVTVPYVAALAAMGYEVGVVTVLPQNSTAYGFIPSAQTVEARRQAYNAAVRANAAGAAFVVDRASGAMDRFPAACDDPALFPDALHPSTAGYALLAPAYAAAINARLV